MVQRVYDKAVQSGATRVIVATDHQKIADVVKAFNGEVMMTSESHESGTERLAEVVDRLHIPDDVIVVNVQGDEPLLPPENVNQVAKLLENSTAPMATLSVSIDDIEEALNPNAVKVVSDANNNALYFSRATIPYDRDRFLNKRAIKEIGDFYQRHIGIYAYRAGFIKEYINLTPSPIEKIEALEQLRVLYHGKTIKVDEAIIKPLPGVDTPDDLAKINAYFNEQD